RELNRAPDDFLTLYYLASLLDKQNDLDAARLRIEAALKQQPQSSEALALAGRVFFKQGRTAESGNGVAEAARARRDRGEARSLRAGGYQKGGRKQAAARERDEVKKLRDAGRKKEKAGKQKP